MAKSHNPNDYELFLDEPCDMTYANARLHPCHPSIHPSMHASLSLSLSLIHWFDIANRND